MNRLQVREVETSRQGPLRKLIRPQRDKGCLGCLERRLVVDAKAVL
jgi:hypothetical protein